MRLQRLSADQIAERLGCTVRQVQLAEWQTKQTSKGSEMPATASSSRLADLLPNDPEAKARARKVAAQRGLSLESMLREALETIIADDLFGAIFDDGIGEAKPIGRSGIEAAKRPAARVAIEPRAPPSPPAPPELATEARKRIPSGPAYAAQSILSIADVTALLGISRTTLWEMEKRGQFPAGFVLGRNAKRWRYADVEAYVEALTEGCR